MFWDKYLSYFSTDLGIDLGTSNTLIYIVGKGIMVRESSVVARYKKTKEIVAVGARAKKMIGKAPSQIEVVKPIRDGVIADFEAVEIMLTKFLGQIDQLHRPRVAISIPSGVTEVESKAVRDVALAAGAQKAFLVEKPLAAAIGIGLPIHQADGILLVDIGGGTTEIAVISLDGIVLERCLKIAGNKMDEAIVNFIRLKYSLLLGEATAEDLKIQIGSAYSNVANDKAQKMVIRGRDLESGLPKSIKIDYLEIREAISPVVRQIVDQIGETIEQTPPELINDIVSRGIVLCGGVSQLVGLDKLIAEETKMPVWVADDPLNCVVKGCAIILEKNEERFYYHR